MVLFLHSDVTFAWVAILRLKLLQVGIVLVGHGIVVLQYGVRAAVGVEGKRLAVVTRQGQAVGHGVVPRQSAGEGVETAVDEQTAEHVVADGGSGLAVALYAREIGGGVHAGTGNGSKVAVEAVLRIAEQARAATVNRHEVGSAAGNGILEKAVAQLSLPRKGIGTEHGEAGIGLLRLTAHQQGFVEALFKEACLHTGTVVEHGIGIGNGGETCEHGSQDKQVLPHAA